MKIFEMLLAILLSSALLLLCADILQRGVKTNYALQAEQEARRGRLRLTELLARGMLTADSHPFPIPPRVHAPGTLSFSDGSTIKIANQKIAPRKDSAALSFLELDFSAGQILQTVSGNSGTACPLWGKKAAAETETFVAASGEILGEIAAQFISRAGNGCTRFFFRPTKSVSLPPQFLEPGDGLYLFPVKEHYTLYLDAEGQVRRLSHAGEAIKENQPLFKGVQAVGFSVEESSGYYILLGIFRAGHKTETLSFKTLIPHSLRGPFHFSK